MNSNFYQTAGLCFFMQHWNSRVSKGKIAFLKLFLKQDAAHQCALLTDVCRQEFSWLEGRWALLVFGLVFWEAFFFAGSCLRSCISGHLDTNVFLKQISMQAASSFDCWEIREDAEPFTTMSCRSWWTALQ